MASLPTEHCFHADNSFTSGFRELSPQHPCSRLTSSATHSRSGLPTQCTNSSTNPTFSPPSPNQPNSLRILQWNSGGLSSSCHAKLCSFLSSNRYDLVLLQETNLSSFRYFKVPGYSVFRADHTLTRRGTATAGNQNGGGVLTLINSNLSFQMVPLPTLTFF